MLTALLSVSLAACIIVPGPVQTRLPDPPSAPQTSDAPASPSAPSSAPQSAAPDVGAAQDCGGDDVVLDDASPSLVLTGDCPDVQVRGDDLEIDLTDARVGGLAVSGDRVVVAAVDVGALTIEGNEQTVTARSIGAVSLRGDGNTVEADESIGAVAVAGNGNTVRGG
jgi:hypothetical protein